MRKSNWAGALFILACTALLMVSVMVGCGDDGPPPPLPECDDDLDCPEGKNCEGGRCIMRVQAAPPPECTSAADCSDNKICVNGDCKYECRVDSDCGAGEECANNRCAAIACDIQRVNFDFNEYYLTSEAQSQLRANADCLKRRNPARIVIEGHCDERGSIEYNLSLGQKRAQSVKDFLVDLGVDTTKLNVLSYGEERPLEYGHNEEAWTKNRRAETVVE